MLVLPSRLADRLDLGDERLGIAGAVREQDTVEAGEVVGVDRAREDRDGGAGAREAAHDRRLGAVVDDRNTNASLHPVYHRLDDRDGRDERLALHRRLFPDQVDRRCLARAVAAVGHDGRPHRAGVADVQHELPRVDVLERNDAVGGEPVGPGAAAAAPHEHAVNPGSCRLQSGIVDAVVPDHRGREGDELPGKARIGDRLLISGHRGREHRLAERNTRSGDRTTREDRAVLECQVAHAHVANTTRPSATVFTTAP